MNSSHARAPGHADAGWGKQSDAELSGIEAPAPFRRADASWGKQSDAELGGSGI